MLIENGVQSRAQVRDALQLNPKDLETICGTPTGFLDETVVPLRLKQSDRTEQKDNRGGRFPFRSSGMCEEETLGTRSGQLNLARQGRKRGEIGGDGVDLVVP
jgi:hypothetical protein